MSKYADEGSIAHALAAMCLREGKDASAYIGRIIECEDYPHAKLAPSAAHRWSLCLGSVALETAEPFKPRKYSMEVTDDMAEDVQVYVDNIRRYADGNVLLIEQTVDVSAYLGPGQTGTGDAIIIAGDELQVHDLKFGRGVDVSAVENKQLRLYALGELPIAELIADIKRVRIVIHQPRIVRAPKEWDCSVEELLAFGEVMKKAAKGVNYVLGLPRDQIDAYLVAGDEQCTFCKAAAVCPAIAKNVSESVYGSFSVIGNPHETAAPREVPREAKLLGSYMSKLDLIESWCTAVRAAVEGSLLGGQEIPGYKLVQGRKGARQWTSEDSVTEVLKSMRLKHDEMYSYTLISPTKAEALLKASPRKWSKLVGSNEAPGFITQKDGKPHVAPVSDARPPLPSVAASFSVVNANADLV